MRRACIAAALLAACGTESVVEGPPIQVVALDTFGGGADYGVIEVWAGACDGPLEELSLRERFEVDGADPGPEVELEPERETCLRVFAVVDEEQTPPFTCSLIGRGQRTVTPSVTDEQPLEIPVAALSDVREGGRRSPRDLENEASAAPICPPRPVAPFEGERLGSEVAPTFRFRPSEGAGTYCVKVRSTDGAFEEERPVAATRERLLALPWDGTALPVGSAVFEWSVRGCPGDCPDPLEPRFAGEGAACTSYSAPRTFVTRPWGDLNGDGLEDFALARPGDQVHVFRSGAGGPAETYDVCGQPFVLETIEPPDPAIADCAADGPLGGATAFFGMGMGMLDLGGDERAELLVGAPNCQREEGGALAEGGVAMFYDGDLVLRGSHAFTGEANPLVYEGFGFDFEAGFRRGAAATDLVTLGGELVGGVIRYRLAAAPIVDGGGDFALGDVEVIERRGYVSGHGDLDGDGYADLPYRELLRLARPDGDPPFSDHPTRAVNSHSVFFGDTDGDGRAEVMIADSLPSEDCRLDLSVVELPADGAGPGVVGPLEHIATWRRRLPLMGRGDCTDPVPERRPPECRTGECDPMDDDCPLCRTPGLSDAMLATALPRGASWAPEGPLGVYARADGRLVVRALRGGTDAEEIPIVTSTPRSRCLGVQMRGLYDLDGDGLNELLVLDPQPVEPILTFPRAEAALLVACGDGDGQLRPIVSDDGVPFAPEGACMDTWSFAP